MNTISISIEARRRQHTLCMCIYSVLVGYLVLNYSNSSPIKTALYLHIFQIASRNTRTHKKVLIDFWCLLPFAFIHSYFISCLFITQIKQYLRQINQTKRNSKTVQSLLFRFFLFTSFMWKRLEKKASNESGIGIKNHDPSFVSFHKKNCVQSIATNPESISRQIKNITAESSCLM